MTAIARATLTIAEIGPWPGKAYAAIAGPPFAVTIHTCPYDAMRPAYQALVSWVSEHGGELAGDPWEVYFSDPSTEPDPATWRTQIIQPYRRA